MRGENAALRWLWARRWVELLDDERAMGAGQAAEDGITTLGLDYHLLTAFTSFVAIDSQVVNAGGQGQNVRQPLPMPEGVSNLAVAEPSAAPGVGAPMKAMGAMGGTGGGAGGLSAHGKMSLSVPVAPAPAPPPAPLASRRASDKEADALRGPRDDRSRSFAKGEEKVADEQDGKDEKQANQERREEIAGRARPGS